ncbi:MAG: alpha-D-glucose phosphate-specific phosphoglucomutase [Elusimicrobiaceae bacterium]|jgi:phosphoglucomutase|nr:alpha-D-glucose phosphate-specific phosphoglucomutase [Elusimicrobiaceae bacterium]MBT3954694.1 alpha-D-glucose phosphate-specific phosphoglucomutase [Elusimicrobiaceae bacterium]MBT4008044.1 alpha-D-glucose phosphate-specific phosphoglucomutase [Elusimicrobiaceae bacterium]MBT4402603.1 alpha-D-glucose phosphate-specific phosphoglucomutase [Elusimicrobiaceae bacterium]MBT4439358.1 alpha-D-glucose phosphate-specific phosphoglucomutase [Elusimicrobiaceae bacterium]
MIHKNAGKLSETKIDFKTLVENFYKPQGQILPVKFGTSGHRGKLGEGFCDIHVKAIAYAVAKYHKENNITGSVMVGGDTRILSDKIAITCAEVLTAENIPVILCTVPTPTPVFAYEILKAKSAVAGLNGTASHNPPEDMGLKYNPSNGGPATADITKKLEQYANQIISNSSEIKTITLEEAKQKGLLKKMGISQNYIKDLGSILDFEKIRTSPKKLALHPMGGTGLVYFEEIKKHYKLDNVDILNKVIDPSFSHIPQDHDGKVRMDPSSIYPMKPLIDIVKTGKYDFAGACDPDADRFGCATKYGELINPNHALCIILEYLLSTKKFPSGVKVARTIATTHLLDKISEKYKVPILETDVGFKYFAKDLEENKLVMGCEESAGVNIYNWTTDKDGILAVFLLAEIMTTTGKDLSELYAEIIKTYAIPNYKRVDIPTTTEQKEKIKKIDASTLKGVSLGGGKVVDIRTTDGIKLYGENCWILIRPSGTEPIIKLYAESFVNSQHLDTIINEAYELFGLKK